MFFAFNCFGQEPDIRNYPQPTYGVSATTRTIPAIKGQKIVDAITGKILEEPRHIFIHEDETIYYSDDGKTLGDIVANDGIYSNVLPPNNKDYIGGSSFYFLKLNLKMIAAIEEMSPLTFFGYTMMTLEEYRKRLIEKNEKTEEWTMRFLDPYRVNKGDIDSPFYQLYIPLPPTMPNTLPPDLNPDNLDLMVPEDDYYYDEEEDY